MKGAKFAIILLALFAIAGACGAQRDAAPGNASGQEALQRRLEQAVEQGDYDLLAQEARSLSQRAGRSLSVMQAYLTHLIARALHQSRQPQYRGELQILWEQLRRHYQQFENTPLAVEATLALAFCLWESDRSRAERLLQEAEARANSATSLPLEVARALSASGEDWFSIQEWAICRRLWERALELQQSADADDLTLARSHYNLGALALKQGRLTDARQQLQRALELQGAEPANPALYVATLSALGETAQRNNEIALAREYYQRALAESRNAETLDAARAHLGLGSIALKLGEWQTARHHYERAYQITESLDPDSREWAMARLGLGSVELERDALDAAASHLNAVKNHPRLEPREKAQVAHELGRLAWRQGNWREAAQQIEQALALQQSLQEPPLAIAKTLYNLGVLMLEAGDLARAREHLQQSLEIRQREAPNSREVAHTLTALGFVAFQERQLDEAQRYFDQAVTLYRVVNAPPLDLSRALMGRGTVATERGELESAQNDLQTAYDLQSAHGAAKAALRAQTLIAFGNLMLRQTRWDLAAAYYNQALRLAAELPRSATLRAQAQIGLGNLALRQRDQNRADSLYTQAWETLQTHNPQSPLIPSLVISLSALAVESEDMGRLEQLEKQLQPHWASNAPLVARMALNKGILYLRRRQDAQAEAELGKALQSLQAHSSSPLMRAHTLYHLGVIEMRRGDKPKARAYFEQALQLQQQVAPNTLGSALAQLSLAKLDYQEGNAASAITRLEEAIRTIERQSMLIFDPDTQAWFSERYYEAYTLLALLEAERGN
ncbi:MAG: tetratricopeptide repeat protein, partial [Fimbriimonadales bacterium]|nr:tetratricopeptide repeat protein [Fimbriimonadales bacterium]